MRQNYRKAHEKFVLSQDEKHKLKNTEVDNDLVQFCQVLSQKKTDKVLTIQEIYPVAKEYLLKDNRHVLKAQIYAWAIMNTERDVDKELEGLESDINWLLSQENGKPIHGKLSSLVGGFNLNLKGNQDLVDIRSIGQLPLKQLNIRQCNVKAMSFTIDDPRNIAHYKYLDSFRQTRLLLIDTDQELHDNAFKRAKIVRP